MNMNTYQKEAKTTAVYDLAHRITYPAMGLAGEAGEVVDKAKKILRGDLKAQTPEYRAEIAKELGDCLWYAAALADDLGFTLEEIAQMNLDKLSSRFDRGVLKGSGDNR